MAVATGAQVEKRWSKFKSRGSWKVAASSVTASWQGASIELSSQKTGGWVDGEGQFYWLQCISPDYASARHELDQRYHFTFWA